MEATLRAARPEDASRISALLEQLGWAVTPDKVVAELSASPTTEVVVADSDDGIGERLVGVALEAAARCSAQVVEAVSHLRRVDARRFYERLGFDVTSNYFVRTP